MSVKQRLHCGLCETERQALGNTELTDKITQTLASYSGAKEDSRAIYRLAFWMGEDPVLCEEFQQLVNQLRGRSAEEVAIITPAGQ